ncbi:MAG: flagellar biosynthetic protein FliR [Planctomycetota bacterium]|jgi:flagellar biosynthetic protein FliR
METWIQLFLPFGLLLGRVSAFTATLPIFSFRTLPMRVRAGMALLLTVFFANLVTIPAATLEETNWVWGMLLMTQEVLTGAGLGLAVGLAFRAISMGGVIIGRSMGMMMAQVIDPTSGQRTQPAGMLFETVFMLFFIIASGHHVVLRIVHQSYDVFPIGTVPQAGQLVAGVLEGSAVMFTVALRLAAPVLAAFLLLSVALAFLARAMPEMNILMMSFPVRMALGFFLAAMLMPSLRTFTHELGDWMARFLGT